MTQYGTANFWILTSLSYTCAPVQQAYSLVITLSGYTSLEDADAGASSIGTYEVTLSQTDIVNLFSGAQILVQEAITNSSAAWAGATYVPPTYA
jgi:hypothetical protein